MTLPHDDSEFGELLRIVAGERGVSEALVEKDYWVTHTLWALSESKLAVWFKGGTSLSKGFGLITRFSEDLDLKIERGQLDTLPVVRLGRLSAAVHARPPSTLSQAQTGRWSATCGGWLEPHARSLL